MASEILVRLISCIGVRDVPKHPTAAPSFSRREVQDEGFSFSQHPDYQCPLRDSKHPTVMIRST
jgi:hypothetical protein